MSSFCHAILNEMYLLFPSLVNWIQPPSEEMDVLCTWLLTAAMGFAANVHVAFCQREPVPFGDPPPRPIEGKLYINICTHVQFKRLGWLLLYFSLQVIHYVNFSYNIRILIKKSHLNNSK